MKAKKIYLKVYRLSSATTTVYLTITRTNCRKTQYINLTYKDLLLSSLSTPSLVLCILKCKLYDYLNTTFRIRKASLIDISNKVSLLYKLKKIAKTNILSIKVKPVLALILPKKKKLDNKVF